MTALGIFIEIIKISCEMSAADIHTGISLYDRTQDYV